MLAVPFPGRISQPLCGPVAGLGWAGLAGWLAVSTALPRKGTLGPSWGPPCFSANPGLIFLYTKSWDLRKYYRTWVRTRLELWRHMGTTEDRLAGLGARQGFTVHVPEVWASAGLRPSAEHLSWFRLL